MRPTSAGKSDLREGDRHSDLTLNRLLVVLLPSPVIIDLCPARVTSSQLLSEARPFRHYYRFFEARDPVSGGVAGGGGRGWVVD